MFSFSSKEPHEKVGERISKIIGVNISARFDRLYKIRNSIVHGGRSYIEKNDLNDIFGLTKSTIITFIKRKGSLRITNVPELQNWLK